MKRKDLVSLYHALNTLTDSYSTKFAYAVSRNKKSLEEEVKILEEHQPKLNEEFVNKKNEVIQKFAEKDSDGKIIWEDINIGLPKYKKVNKKKAETEVEKLSIEYSEDISTFDAKSKEFVAFLDEDYEIELYKVDIDSFPETIDQKVMDIIGEAMIK